MDKDTEQLIREPRPAAIGSASPPPSKPIGPVYAETRALQLIVTQL